MKEPEARKETILVFISAHPKTHVLIRSAATAAKEQDLNWTAVYVDSGLPTSLDSEGRARMLRYASLIDRLGGEYIQIENKTVIDGIIDFTKEFIDTGETVKSVIIGQSSKEGFFAELRASLAERVAREMRHVETQVQIIPLSGVNYAPSWFERLQLRDINLLEIGYAILYVAIAFAATELLRFSVSTTDWWINEHNVMAFFLVACIITALRFGLVPGLVSALLGFTAINYFYSAPLYNFGITNSADGISLLIFLFSSIVVALMGAYSRASYKALIRKERRSQALYSIHRVASNANTRMEALKILHEQLSKLLEMQVAFFMPPTINPESIELVYPPEVSLSEDDTNSLQLCWDYSRTTGLGAINRYDSNWRFEPMITSNGEIGVLGIQIENNIYFDSSFGRLLTALADQAANLIERLELTKMMSESRMREEREKLRAMLLSSVSHDLKTPLASIIGSLSVFKRMRKSDRLSVEIGDELTETALDEAQRLDSFISNILDMTRIESGEIEFDKEWIDPTEPIASIKKRLRQRLRLHTLKIDEPDQAYEVEMDQMMTEQVLQNIIDNAAKYSPANTEISIDYGPEDNGFSFRIRDQGKGIPEGKFEAIFDKYERLRQSDSQVAGTGLGLAISKASMEKQNGYVKVKNHADGGAEFIIWFPKYRRVDVEERALSL